MLNLRPIVHEGGLGGVGWDLWSLMIHGGGLGSKRGVELVSHRDRGIHGGGACRGIIIIVFIYMYETILTTGLRFTDAPKRDFPVHPTTCLRRVLCDVRRCVW